MPSAADIIKDYVTEFSRLQDWMIPIKEAEIGRASWRERVFGLV